MRDHRRKDLAGSDQVWSWGIRDFGNELTSEDHRHAIKADHKESSSNEVLKTSTAFQVLHLGFHTKIHRSGESA